MQKLILSATFALLSSFLISCATPPPNVPVCAEINMERGACVYTMTGKEVEINETTKLEGKTWWEARPAMILMPWTSWVAIRGWIIKTCKANENMCNKAVSSWDRQLETIDKNVKKKLP